MITVARTCSALLIAIDNINTVCEIVLLINVVSFSALINCVECGHSENVSCVQARVQGGAQGPGPSP